MDMTAVLFAPGSVRRMPLEHVSFGGLTSLDRPDRDFEGSLRSSMHLGALPRSKTGIEGHDLPSGTQKDHVQWVLHPVHVNARTRLDQKTLSLSGLGTTQKPAKPRPEAVRKTDPVSE